MPGAFRRLPFHESWLLGRGRAGTESEVLVRKEIWAVERNLIKGRGISQGKACARLALTAGERYMLEPWLLVWDAGIAEMVNLQTMFEI